MIGRRNGGRRRRWASRKRGHSGLSLTSLMDILTCLLFFVLKSFVAGGESTVPPPGLTLPSSSAERAQATSLVVAIQKDAIYVGGERVASVAEAEASPQMLIAPLAERVKAARAQMDEIALQRGKRPEASHLVTIQGDSDIEFRVLQKVMFTLDQGGFPDIALAVLKKA
jgi:biopolymer transport protein ExbD